MKKMIQTSNVEFYPSYKETSLHAKITCKCGKDVWYGYGKGILVRPKYCSECTMIEVRKFRNNLPATSNPMMDAEIIDKYFVTLLSKTERESSQMVVTGRQVF